MRTDHRFWMGITAGLVVMFGGMQLKQGREPAAHAAPQGVDNQGKFALAVGGSEANRNDLLWVLHEHPPHSDLRPARGGVVFSKPAQITLCLYKAEKQGEKMKLMAARDIAFDIEFQNLNQESPDMKSVYEHFKDLAERNAKK
jgi:hypothetical protein